MKSREVVDVSLNGKIIYNMLGSEAYIEFLNKTENTVQKAVEVLEKGESFPQAPASEQAAKENDERRKTEAA